MLRCIKAHHVDAFGDIPVGSLWADDSPYVTDESFFVDADAKPAPAKKSAASREED